jgi:serine/threonine protein phosphatase PrpC
VIGRCEHGSNLIYYLGWKSHDLSRDHKPSEQDEKERILKKNGRIEPFRDENGEFIGPERVWLMDEEIPGLAMSRSFGDEVAASVGTNAEPEIKEYMYNKNDAFFIIASDGIWEFIQSEEVRNKLNLVCKYNKRLLFKKR